MTFSLAPPISSGNKLRVLRIGMPNAAPWPVVGIVTPTLTSCAGADAVAIVAAAMTLVINVISGLIVLIGSSQIVDAGFARFLSPLLIMRASILASLPSALERQPPLCAIIIILDYQISNMNERAFV